MSMIQLKPVRHWEYHEVALKFSLAAIEFDKGTKYSSPRFAKEEGLQLMDLNKLAIAATELETKFNRWSVTDFQFFHELECGLREERSRSELIQDLQDWIKRFIVDLYHYEHIGPVIAESWREKCLLVSQLAMRHVYE